MMLPPPTTPRITHMASKIARSGSVSALCSATPRAINMKRVTWTISPAAVTCRKCKAALKEGRGELTFTPQPLKPMQQMAYAQPPKVHAEPPAEPLTLEQRVEALERGFAAAVLHAVANALRAAGVPHQAPGA